MSTPDWQALHPPADLHPVGDLLADLQRRHDAPGRHYHTWSHVQAVCDQLHRVTVEKGWDRPREVFVAALFHDVIYEVGRKDNEEKSADFAVASLSSAFAGPVLDASVVRRLIELTAQHGSLDPATLSADEARFLDADMAILGAPWPAFAAYDSGVELEYRALYDAEAYRLGRGHFLRHLLDHPPIFLSPFFRQRLEDSARENLERAISR